MASEKGDKEPPGDVELEGARPRMSSAGSRRQSMSRLGSARPSLSKSARSSLSTRGVGLFGGSNPFESAARGSAASDDEDELRWAALEKLPTFNRLRTSVLTQDSGSARQVDVQDLSTGDFAHLVEKFHRSTDDENQQLLVKLRQRLDRVGIELPTVDVRYDHLSIRANCHVGNRGLPTLLNVIRDVVEVQSPHIFQNPSQIGKNYPHLTIQPTSDICLFCDFQSFLDLLHVYRTKKQVLTILDDVSGSLKPGR